MLQTARLFVCHSWIFLFICSALFFPVVAVWKVWLVICSARGRAQKDHMLQLARRFLSGHSSPVSGRPPRELLLIPFYPVSEVWEPVTFNEEGARLRKVPASSDLNDWLLFVVTGLNWLHGINPNFHFQSVFVGPPSKVQTMALNLLADEVSQFFHQCGGVMEEVDWDRKLQSRTVGYDGAEVYTAECLDLKGFATLFLQLGWVVWSMRRTSALVL